MQNIHNFTKIIRIFLRIYVFARVDIDNQHHWWSEIAVQIQSCSFCHLCGNKITKGGRSPRKRLRFDPQTKAAILLQITNITVSISKTNDHSCNTALCFSHDLTGSWPTMTNWNTNVSNKFTRPLDVKKYICTMIMAMMTMRIRTFVMIIVIVFMLDCWLC